MSARGPRSPLLRVVAAVAAALVLAPPPVPSAPAGAQERPPAVWRTLRSDQGANWGDARALMGVDFVTPQVGFAAAANLAVSSAPAEGRVLRTNDGGRTWAEVRSDVVRGYLALDFLDEDTGVAVGFSSNGGGVAIVRTTDGGGGWSEVLSTGPKRQLNGVAFAFSPDPGIATGVAVGKDVVSGVGWVVRSTDGGASWTAPVQVAWPSGGSKALNGVAFVTGAPVGVAVGEGGTILRTTDGGATWASAAVTWPTGGPKALYGVSFAPGPDPTQALGIAVGDQGTLLRSTDGGATWAATPTPFDSLPAAQRPGLRGVALTRGPSGLQGYVVGQRLTVLEMSDQDGTQWAFAPVDPRNAPASNSNAFSLAEKVNLQAVAASATATADMALAVGVQGAMVKRTTDPAEAVRDAWWRCVPTQTAANAGVGPEADDGVQEATGEPVLCPKGTVPVAAPADPGFGATPAGPCATSGDPLFPCTAAWQPRTELGEPSAAPADGSGEVFLDEGFPEGRRVVLVRGGASDNSLRVFLFDPDRAEQRGVAGLGAGFAGFSAYGSTTGVVNLADAPGGVPGNLSARGATYDSTRHRLFLKTNTLCPQSAASLGCQGVQPAIVTMSLTGEFPPALTRISERVSDEQQGRVNLVMTHMAFDPRHEMLYALTEFSPYRDYVFAFPGETFTHRQVTLYAFDTSGEDDPATPGDESKVPVRKWSLSLEDRCHTTGGLNHFGVSRDGSTVAFACQGHALVPHFGSPTLESHKVMTVELKLRGRAPKDLNPANPADVAVRGEPAAGRVMNEPNVATGTDALDLLVWGQRGGAVFYDYGTKGWIGSVASSGVLGAAGDAGTGRLYLPTQSDGLVVLDTLNLPVDKVTKVVDAEPPLGAGRFEGLVVRPRRDRPTERPRVLAISGGALHLYEDRVAPVLPRRAPDPDTATHDIPESRAASVTRTGRARAYGARVWWTGLTSSLPGSCADLNCNSIDFTYDDVFNPQRLQGEQASAVPGRPGAGSREVRAGWVERATLENAHSEAEARGLAYDGGPGDSGGNTGDDLKRRRGARDTHEYADAQVRLVTDGRAKDPPLWGGTEKEFCSRAESPEDEEACREGHDDFREGHEQLDEMVLGPFSVHVDEGIDRAMREADGERRVKDGCDDPETDANEGDCFPQFDGDDPRCGRDDPKTKVDESSCTVDAEGRPTEDERSSVEQRAEMTYASRCLEPGGEASSFAGSKVGCSLLDRRTEASAGLEALSLQPDRAQGASVGLSVGATNSDVQIFRDQTEGIVAEVSATAADVELTVPGHGSLRIGEVRTSARARAKGRAGTAASWVDVAYEDVVITGPGGEERFACGRADPADSNGLADDPRFVADRDGDGVLTGDRKDKDDEHGTYDATIDDDDLDGTPPEARTDPDDADHLPVACDPHRVVDVINRVFTDKVSATTSDPDTDPETRGSDGGVQAMVRRDPARVMSDEVVNKVPRLYELPALQLTIFNDGMRPNRLQVDLAAVYAEVSYAIGAPAVEEFEEPGSIEVELTDGEGAALAGGGFTVLEDVDADGALGADDVPVAECTTGDDGTCGFEGLEAGDYLVEQRHAPAGYLRQDAPAAVSVAPGSVSMARFVNVSDSAGVEVLLVDPTGRPLAGGRFVLVADAQGNQRTEPSDRAVVTCVTGASGTCTISQVSLGAYLLHQEAAPRGYRVAKDVPFTLGRPGQVARIKVVNGTQVSGASVEIIEIIGALPAVSSPQPSWLARLPGSLANILLRGWVQALLFALTALLLGAPLYLAHRRRELALAKQQGA